MIIQQEKIRQIPDILKELSIDAWLVFVRETNVAGDPIMPLVVGIDVVWQSFFIYTQDGGAIALVGNFDEEDFKRCGYFTDVKSYTADPREIFQGIMRGIKPGKIAVNFSKDDPSADGLTYGMYQMLLDYLEGTGFAEKLISAEDICRKVRSRKTESEVKRIAEAAQSTVLAWNRALPQIKCGIMEKEVAGLIDKEILKLGGLNSFPTIVNAGAKTKPGHGRPTDAVLEPGDLLHVDFGMNLNDYCSDLQRLIYFKKPDEKEPPDSLIRSFGIVRDIITAAAEITAPGAIGSEVDAVARRMLVESGNPEYQHALGHQLGRDVHDGGALIGPKWARYGNTPMIPLEAGNVFTLELEIMLPEIGCVGLEEDVCIRPDGPAEFLCDRQMELIVK